MIQVRGESRECIQERKAKISMKKVGDIIRADEARVYVVPSAPGKRFSEDTKVTDMLLHVYETASERKDIAEEMKAI